MADSVLKGWKTMEKEKLLVMSNFSFFCRVFKRLVLQTHKNQGLFGKGLILYHTIHNLIALKEEAFREQFFQHFQKIYSAIFSFWACHNFVV